MQDGAPCHTAKSIKTYLASKNNPLLDWPGNSPDMNPIENVWEILKRKMNKINITNKKDLIARLISVWFHDDDIKIAAMNCIKSMPDRIRAIIKAKGGGTKY
jgi:transposase